MSKAPSLTDPTLQATHAADPEGVGLLDLAIALATHWKALMMLPIVAGAAAVGASFLVTPTFTARTIFIPPQQQQSAAASALASLGSLAALAGGGASVKTQADLYVTLMQSVNVEDRIVDKFDLMKVYEAKYRFEARKELESNTLIQLGKKDGLITVEVQDDSPARAADIANEYVAQLRRLSGELALTEAQQRRVFFEREMKQTHARLADAEAQLQASGFNAAALKAEPRAAAESYAQVKAELTAAEVRLQILRRTLTDSAAEVMHQMTLVSALRQEVARLETSGSATESAGYLSRYREFKYQESLYELYAKQFELARVDESRDSATIQVVDAAQPPEHKSKPRRAMLAAGAAVLTFLLLVGLFVARAVSSEAKRDPATAAKFKRLGLAWRGRKA